MVVLQTATLFGAGSTVIVTGAAIFLMPRLLAGQPGAVDGARIYALAGIPLVLLGFPISFMRALQRYGLWNLLRLIAPFCWLTALLIFAALGKDQAEPLILTFLVLQLMFIPLVWSLARREKRGPGGVDRKLISPMVRYGTPLFLATLPRAINLRFDQILIANIESADQLGRYAVSVAWAGLGLPIMTAISFVLLPKLAAMDPKHAQSAFAQSVRAGVILALVLSTITGLTAPALVPLLFGRSFAVPFILSLSLAAATSFLGLNGILEEGLSGLGKPRSVLVGELAGLLVTILLLLVLLPRLGIIGAAHASLGGYTATFAVLTWLVRRQSDRPISEFLIPGSSDIADIVGRSRSLQTYWTARK